jgi:hypothetical protein
VDWDNPPDEYEYPESRSAWDELPDDDDLPEGF